MKDIIQELKTKLMESVKRDKAGGLLFSGGIDSAILASLSSNTKAITVNLKPYGEDVKYAASVAKFLNIKHHQKSIDVDEAIEAIPEVIKILKTFDPAIPNDLVVYFGLKQAKELGIDEVMTGDGSDEIFAGYNFMLKINDLGRYIERISQNMRFSSNDIGDFLGIKIVQPFLNKEVVDFALSINPEFKLRKEKEKFLGKWILRRAFEDTLPQEVIWQSKRALEIGSGMSKIRETISAKVTDEEFKENSFDVKFMNKEHFYYYKVYRDVIGKIPEPNKGESSCVSCSAGLNPAAFHCKVCGHVFDL